jgi:hypothetical protein
MAWDHNVIRGLVLAWVAVVVFAFLSGPLYMLVTWVIYVKVDHLPTYGMLDWSVALQVNLDKMLELERETLTA